MLSKELLDILACPQCKGDLDYETEPHQLKCPKCRLIYHITDDIPNFLIEEAESF